MTAGAAVLHFGVVRAAGQDIAIASSELVEAVDMPQQLLPLPEPSSVMAGMFLLRGRLIPVLDLQRLMAPAASPSVAPAFSPAGDGVQPGAVAPAAPGAASRRRQVAVVAHGRRRLGIGVDTIAGVLRVPPSAVTPLGGAQDGLFGHWVTTQEPASRALPVLQVPALLERTPGVTPAVDPPAGAPGAAPAQAAAATRRHTLASLEGQVLAFDFADVPDILPMPPMRAFFAAGGPLRGLVPWRGCDVPVVDLQRLLGMERAAPDGAQAPSPGVSKPLLMVLQRGGRRIGVQADAVLGMETATPDATVPLGPGASLNPGCYAGAMRTSAHGIAAVLRVEGLLAHPVVAAFLDSRPAAAGTQAGPQAARGGGARTTFLVYRAGGDCATPLAEVEEILDYATPAVQLDGAGSGMCGLVERKGRPLEVFCLRTLLGSAKAGPTAQSRVLVVRHGERLRGFLVDSLVSLVAADATAEIGHEPSTPSEGSRRPGSGLGRMLTVGKGADAVTCRKVGLHALLEQSLHDFP
ncbi:CheW domain protein [Paracidovorax avenae ATCC 19860]|uniref:CheW domain protein n=1 Tax=Paracidovorax avenae (strain ATCC 19860 / DSM 7227 / CCUG 15838 / JCM 20985 / LMG 2117 / NCPPB 1011) TaxID=643561 RepID=F0Q7S9_PARA1|nr:chemotaxis protein CheW [Paracidovorax avenae]ADX48261.1 CheW domain protein [Paracidovorax avenae ATCC 19860]